MRANSKTEIITTYDSKNSVLQSNQGNSLTRLSAGYHNKTWQDWIAESVVQVKFKAR